MAPTRPSKAKAVKAQPQPQPQPQPKIVERLANAMGQSPATQQLFANQVPGALAIDHLAGSANFPDLYMFAGFVGGAPIQQPGVPTKLWQLVYLDLQLRNWLLLENDAIVYTEVITDSKVPGGERDVYWVSGDAAVGIGKGSQSLEAQFLTGEFTRAADFRASPAGGTLAAATGVFCEAESIGCCRPSS
jgi:hypothetical protein